MDGSRIRIDASEFGELFRELEAVDKKLANAMRKRLRDQGKPLVQQMRKALTSPTSRRSASIKVTKNRTRRTTSVDFDGTKIVERETYQQQVRTTTSALVAQGLAFRMGTGQSPSIRFAGSSAKLPANRKPMAKALNKKSFRHPTFGNRDKWVTQTGRPYFGSVLLSERERLLQAIDTALDDIAKQVGRSRIRH